MHWYLDLIKVLLMNWRELDGAYISMEQGINKNGLSAFAGGRSAIGICSNVPTFPLDSRFHLQYNHCSDG